MKRSEEKEEGVVMQDSLTPERHNNGLLASTHRTLTNIRLAFNYMGNTTRRKIITTIITHTEIRSSDRQHLLTLTEDGDRQTDRQHLVTLMEDGDRQTDRHMRGQTLQEDGEESVFEAH
ncbi:hypothetical protein E2C01_089746 [Portunus trituberculatus]|uniref:Uncharacterized protein n=1 Tax=Portunus trituberculatus TaxID=210409 RepID=A0A5B7JEF0_PORTR|nr:hypothetical protein [Portunus trituberculatus]